MKNKWIDFRNIERKKTLRKINKEIKLAKKQGRISNISIEWPLACNGQDENGYKTYERLDKKEITYSFNIKRANT